MRPFELEPEYIALVEPDTLEPVVTLAGEALLALAARVGEVRLIDNAILSPAPAHGGHLTRRAAPARGTGADRAEPTRDPSQPLEGEIAACSA